MPGACERGVSMQRVCLHGDFSTDGPECRILPAWAPTCLGFTLHFRGIMGVIPGDVEGEQKCTASANWR